MYFDIFFYYKFVQRSNKYKTTSKGALCLVSALVSRWESASLRPYGPCPQADTQPDTRVDSRPRTLFSVSLIYIPKSFSQHHIMNSAKYFTSKTYHKQQRIECQQHTYFNQCTSGACPATLSYSVTGLIACAEYWAFL